MLTRGVISNHFNPLKEAIDYLQPESITTLINADYSVHLLDAHTPLIANVAKKETKTADDMVRAHRTVIILFENGASLEQPVEFGFAPLHLAVQRADFGFTKLLLNLGAQTETRDKQGRTALHWGSPDRQCPAYGAVTDKESKQGGSQQTG